MKYPVIKVLVCPLFLSRFLLFLDPGFQVIDPETGKSLSANKEGELCFRGPLIMKGYKNNPTATAGTIDKEGWLHTGDIGFYDDNQWFYVVDRIKELIKYNALQVNILTVLNQCV